MHYEETHLFKASTALLSEISFFVLNDFSSSVDWRSEAYLDRFSKVRNKDKGEIS